MKKLSKIALFSILTIIQTFDAITTIFIISTGGTELNPIGIQGILILKIFTTSLFGIIFFSNKDKILEK